MVGSEAKEHQVEDADRLMARVRNRDAAAFEALYDAYHRLVYGVALRMLSDVSAAEDVTQAVFLKIWSSPNLFSSGNFSGWIVRMTRNRALDVLRSKSRTQVELSDQQPDDDPIEERAFAALDAEQVRSALKQLPPEQRELIELGFFSGITHEELSRRTGVALGTVKTRIRSGLRRLRSTLEGTVTAV
jgi:RNA polymerase sigma-70 factor (ECF subfamily)